MTPPSYGLEAIIDEMLDEIGFGSKPGSTKGRMRSSRFYHTELKSAIRYLVHKQVTKARLEPTVEVCKLLDLANIPNTLERIEYPSTEAEYVSFIVPPDDYVRYRNLVADIRKLTNQPLSETEGANNV